MWSEEKMVPHAVQRWSGGSMYPALHPWFLKWHLRQCPEEVLLLATLYLGEQHPPHMSCPRCARRKKCTTRFRCLCRTAQESQHK